MRVIACSILTLALCGPVAAAQDYAGRYRGSDPQGGELILELQPTERDRYAGTLLHDGITWQVEAFVDEAGLVGLLESPNDMLAFEAQLGGGQLQFVVARITPDGDIDHNAMAEFVFQREGAAAARGGRTPFGEPASPPVRRSVPPGPEDRPAGAVADPAGIGGVYELRGRQRTMELTFYPAGGQGYLVTLKGGPAFFVGEGRLQGEYVVGMFEGGTTDLMFQARRRGDQLEYVQVDVIDREPQQGTATQNLLRRIGDAPPAAQADLPPVGDPTAPPWRPVPGERDRRLVGRWMNESTRADPYASMTTVQYREYRADGVMLERDGGMAGGGSGWSVQQGASGQVERWEWRTDDNRLFIRSEGADEWMLGGTYHVEGGRMMIRPANDRPTIWERMR